MPKTRPRPMNWKLGRLKTCRLPLVNTWAMPRPAMNSTRVAMIGWMRRRVTSQPLNQPSAPATRTGTTKASAMPTAGWGRGKSLPRKISGASAPAIAMSAPDGEVDAAGGDDQGHPDADDHDGADLGEVDVERLPGGEVGRDGEIDQDQERQGDPGAMARQQGSDIDAGSPLCRRKRSWRFQP